MKVVTITDMHYTESVGGSHISTYHHAKAMADMQIETFFFGGRAKTGKNTVPIEKIAETAFLHEYLLNLFDHGEDISLEQHREYIFSCLNQMVNDINPDIIHFNSLHELGLGLIERISCPRSKKVYTIRNYLPVCLNTILVKVDGRTPCTGQDISQCNTCYPNIPQGVFTTYRQASFSYLGMADMLTTPGKFARNLYVKLGISASKIRCIPNGTDIPKTDHALRSEDGVLRLGFIGRIPPYKGIDVIFGALQMLPSELRAQNRVHLHVFGQSPRDGDGKWAENKLPAAYARQLEEQLSDIEAMVSFHGSFGLHERTRLLQGIDCLVVPSLWWEVTPRVIHEAFACGRPVLCSNIGGMAEMVEDGKDGLFFEAGSAIDLSEKIMLLVNNRTLLNKLHTGILYPQTISEMAKNYVDMYKEMLK